MNAISRRELVAKILGGLAPMIALCWSKPGTAKPLTSKAMDSEKKIIIRTSFFSLKSNAGPFSTTESFWLEHSVPDSYDRARNLFRISGVAGRKLSSAICSQSGAPIYYYEYSSWSTYHKHLALITGLYGIEKTELSGNKLRYDSKDFYAIDELVESKSS